MIEYDVIVAGGGVSGVTAATAAARNGARTLIVERHNCLGGTMAAALVGPMMTFHDALGRQVIAGLAQEVVDRLVALDASPGHIPDTSGYTSTITPFDNEYLKLVTQRMVLEAGADILFQTYITGVSLRNGAVEGLVIENKGGRSELGAKIVIDATGDADVAARAGAPFTVGRPQDHFTQPASLMFKVGGFSAAPLKAYAHAHPEEFRLSPDGVAGYDREPLIAVCAFEQTIREARASGELHVDRDVVLFFNTNHADEAFINMSRVTKLDPLDPWALSRADDRLPASRYSRFWHSCAATCRAWRTPACWPPAVRSACARAGASSASMCSLARIASAPPASPTASPAAPILSTSTNLTAWATRTSSSNPALPTIFPIAASCPATSTGCWRPAAASRPTTTPTARRVSRPPAWHSARRRARRPLSPCVTACSRAACRSASYATFCAGKALI